MVVLLHMNKTLTGTIAGAIIGGGVVFGATALPAKDATPITWDTSLQSGQEISQAYIDIANSLGVTATDSGKHGGNIQLIIQEKVKGEMCK